MLLNAFLDPVFLAFLLKAVNRAFTDGKEKLLYYDIELCLKTLFWLHFYCCSPTALFDKKVRKAYGPASDLSEELWKRFMKGISYDTEGQHYGAHFKSTMTMDHVLADASTSAWKNSVNMLFNPSTLCSLDDDHLHLRAKRNAALGLVRKHNPHKGYGPDQHVCTSVGTNCILAAQVESKSTGLNACMQNLLDVIAHGSKDNTVNHDIALDRGYSSINNVNKCAMVGL